MRYLVLVALIACGPRFLGQPLPATCKSSYARCNADLRLATMRDSDFVDDPALQRYLASVVTRVARGTTLEFVPDIVFVVDGSAAVSGRRILLGRTFLLKLGSEAELAGIFAHELVHLEADNDEESYVGEPVDEEAIADERAVELVVRAGYPADAVTIALGHLEAGDDPYHLPPAARVARTRLLADLRPSVSPPPDDRRDAFLDAISGRVVEMPRERFARIGNEFVFADRAVAIEVPAGNTAPSEAQFGEAKVGLLAYHAWRLGGPESAATVRATLDHATEVAVAVGTATVGPGIDTADHRESSLARLVASNNEALGYVPSGEVGAVIETTNGGVLLTVSGTHNATALDAWLATERRPTDAERALATSARLRLVRAPRTATVRELVAACVDPKAALALDSPDRVVKAGERFKCTDRVPLP